MENKDRARRLRMSQKKKKWKPQRYVASAKKQMRRWGRTRESGREGRRSLYDVKLCVVYCFALDVLDHSAALSEEEIFSSEFQETLFDILNKQWLFFSLLYRITCLVISFTLTDTKTEKICCISWSKHCLQACWPALETSHWALSNQHTSYQTTQHELLRISVVVFSLGA